jgi:hypothetical protein
MIDVRKRRIEFLKVNDLRIRRELLRIALPNSLIVCFLVLVTATLFGGTSQVKTESPSGPTQTPAVLQSPPPKQGLNFVVGARGLDSLSFNGQSLLASPENGALQPQKSIFRAALDAVLPRSSSAGATANKQADTIDLNYQWGRVSCAYGKQDDRLTMRIEVSNTSSEPVTEFSIRLMELTFPRVPYGGTLEAGMFGFAFKGPDWRLDQWPPSIPVVADPRFVVPIVRLDYGSGALNFCSDDAECSVSVPYSTNLRAGARYPLVITCQDIKPGVTREFKISLRFGTAGAPVEDLSRDVLKEYAKKYPFQVAWTDRRPIGAIFLAGAGINSAINPRRWSFNAGKIDVSTEEGRRSFRKALLQLADYSISVLKRTNAQGMITWDPEGEEFLGACYYGDPSLVSRLTPEMEFKGSSEKSVVDEYFEKFRAAGLKVGVCIRPQQIAIRNREPVHQDTDDDHATEVLRERIGYARQRWGCTLFYVDSTTTAAIGGRSYYPDVFKAVAQAYPDVLLIPENESNRYFAYSAPLNSYVHHKITSTPAGARMVYHQAFSVLMASDGDRLEHHAALVDAVRRGDILLFNCLYNDAGAEKIQKIYLDAGRQIAPDASLPNQ